MSSFPTHRRQKSKSSKHYDTNLPIVGKDSPQKDKTAQVPMLEAVDKPLPPPADKCPLFCCFYAEFDDIVGPTIVFQSPHKFMDQDIEISCDDIHVLLEDAIQKELNKTNWRVDEVPDETQSEVSESTKATKVSETTDDDEFWSIFDTTSEFIITGHELAGQMMNLSTHNFQLLTRPTIISDERYNRNALLFSVGFVLRKSSDSTPFRPVLTKVANTLRTMEVESQFLTTPHLRKQVQRMMEHLLVSLNSGECHMLLNEANALNLKLFRPPRAEAAPVPEYAVPILLRIDWAVQMIEWDFAINWVILHIDGVADAATISEKSKVDPEMVLACLRVLKHHDIIAVVDKWSYSNRYECTPMAGDMIGGENPKFLQEALEYASKTTSINNVDPDNFDHGLEVSPLNPQLATAAASAASQDGHPGLLFRREQRKMRAVVAEFYLSCHRRSTVADFWLSKLKRSPSSSGSLNEDNDTTATTAEPTTTTTTKSSEKVIVMSDGDWKNAFETLDHRRLAVYGVIRGVIQRVHNFPFAMEVAVPSDSSSASNHSLGKSARSVDTTDSAPFAAPSADEIQAVKVAEMMNGKNCDDALVCKFHKPIDDLVDLVQTHTKKKVLPILCTVTEWGHSRIHSK